MSHVQEELDRIRARLIEKNAPDSPESRRLYDMQQALAWAQDPRGVRSPFNMVMGIPAEPADCLAPPHQLPSSDIYSRTG